MDGPHRSHGTRVAIVAALIGFIACLAIAPIAVMSSAQAHIVAEDDPSSEPTVGDLPPLTESAEPSPSSAEIDEAESAPPQPTPSSNPSVDIDDEPSDEPSHAHAHEPADDPSDAATDEPSDEVSDEATDAPTDEPSHDPGDDSLDEANDIPSDEGSDSAKDLSISLGGDVGQGADSATVDASGSGLAPGSRFEVWAFSTPTLVTTGTADDSGSFEISAPLPSGLEPGTHSLLLRGTDASGQPVEIATGFTIGADGTLTSVDEPVDASTLAAPTLPTSAMAPPYAPVVALDNPAAVVTTAIAGLAVVSALGAAAAGRTSSGSESGGGSNSGSDDPAGGGINEGGSKRSDELLDVSTQSERTWRRSFTPQGTAWGDHSALHRLPLTSVIDEAFTRVPLAIAAVSPVLGRIAGDGAPIRAMLGSGSLVLPIAGLVLGASAAISGGGIAQPPALGFLVALIGIGILDAFGGLLAAAAFSLVVAVSGGLISWDSVRTLLGVVLLIVGPGLIGSSFRAIRRVAASGGRYAWDRLADLVIVPLFAGYVTYNIASSLPPLGGSQFPIGDQAITLSLFVVAMMVLKVVLEEVAARWFPERLATVLPREMPEPGAAQQLISAAARTALFLFISAAFVGNVWQLWVAGMLFLIPSLVEPFATRFANSPRIWRLLPEGLSLLAFILLVSLIISNALASSLSDGALYARMAFVILLVPDVVLGLLSVFGRAGDEHEVRWYLRPDKTTVYRVGGVCMLAATAWLVLRTTAG